MNHKKKPENSKQNQTGRNSHYALFLQLGILVSVLAVLLALFIPKGNTSTAALFAAAIGKSSRAERLVFYHVRLPRTAAAFISGAALSAAGLLLQTVLNNRLASPSVIGVNSGAGLGVLLAALLFPYKSGVKISFAFLGAILTVFLVYLLSRRIGVTRSTLILAGIAVSALLSGFTDLIVTLRPDTVTDHTAFRIGGFGVVSTQALLWALLSIGAALVLTFLLGRSAGLLSLGDETAYGLGVNVRRTRLFALILAGVLSGASVSIAGILGFIGLIIPNLIRTVCPADFRKTLLLTIFWGGAFLVLSDLVSSTIAYPYELPVGLLMSFIGAPFFLWILLKRRKHLEL